MSNKTLIQQKDEETQNSFNPRTEVIDQISNPDYPKELILYHPNKEKGRSGVVQLSVGNGSSETDINLKKWELERLRDSIDFILMKYSQELK